MKILEAGHYYSIKGPTMWSVMGWKIMLSMRTNNDKSMLFIDDVHGLNDMSPAEVTLAEVDFNPEPDYKIFESSVVRKAWEVLNTLKTLPRKKRVREKSGIWYCSGFPLTNSRKPNCVLLDAGLTLIKSELGFKKGVNILPKFYEEQQKKLLRLVTKALPNFCLHVVLYDLNGKFWNLNNKAR